MNFEFIKAWLEKQSAREIRMRWIMALIGLLLTPIGIAAGACVVFFITWVATRDNRGSEFTPTCYWAALGSIPFLFIVNAGTRSSKKVPEKYYHDDADDPSFADHYSRRYQVQGQILFWLLLTGPRLVDWAIDSFRRIRQLKTQDTHGCAAILFVVLMKAKRTSYDDIQRELDWLDVPATLPQLEWIEGIMFLNVEPPAMSITDDLRTAIRTGEPPP